MYDVKTWMVTFGEQDLLWLQQLHAGRCSPVSDQQLLPSKITFFFYLHFVLVHLRAFLITWLVVCVNMRAPVPGRHLCMILFCRFIDLMKQPGELCKVWASETWLDVWLLLDLNQLDVDPYGSSLYARCGIKNNNNNENDETWLCFFIYLLKSSPPPRFLLIQLKSEFKSQTSTVRISWWIHQHRCQPFEVIWPIEELFLTNWLTKLSLKTHLSTYKLLVYLLF